MQALFNTIDTSGAHEGLYAMLGQLASREPKNSAYSRNSLVDYTADY